MGTWQTFIRFALTSSVLFALVLAFSLLNVDPGTAAGREALVVSTMALIPTVLTIVGTIAIISTEWDPF